MSGKFAKLIDDVFSQSKIIEVNGEKYVHKNYNYEPGLIKWFLITTANNIVKIYPYVIDPEERMKREISFFKNLSPRIKTPRVILADWIHIETVREYIDGTHIDLLDDETYSKIGRILARIHLHGYIMGDTKHYNFIATSSGEIAVIDGEQAIEDDKTDLKAWDLAVFMVTAIYGVLVSKIIVKPNIVDHKTRILINSYCDESMECIDVLEAFNKQKIKNIIYLILPLPYSYRLTKTVKNLYNEKKKMK